MIAVKIALMSSVRGISLPQSLVPAVGMVRKDTAPASTFCIERPSLTSDSALTFSTKVARVKAPMKPLSFPGSNSTLFDNVERSSDDRNFCCRLIRP